jgi:chaperone modulatory protein CbpM
VSAYKFKRWRSGSSINGSFPTKRAPRLTFSDTDVARAHLIRDLKSDFGVNDEGIDVILHLVDQLHGLRWAFEQIHRDVQDSSP